MRAHRVSCLGWIVLLAACATNPVTGKKELVLVSEAQEIELGRQTAEQVRQAMGLYGDPALERYVSEIGMGLARASERPAIPWAFHVIDSPVVNAFALPGGPVYLTRGILAHMNSEAAMVGVLGHEIGHIAARHSVQQISRSQLAGLGLGVGMVFFPKVQPFGDLVSTGLGVLSLKFSRDDETEADTLGVHYAVAAGYDPAEMASFFAVLSRLGGASRAGVPSWLSTHPDPASRRERILQQLQSAPVARDRLAVREAEFKHRIEGLVYGEDPRQGFMDGSVFKHPELKFQLELPPGWNVENTPQAVYAAPADGQAALQLTASHVRSGARPEAYGRAFFKRHQMEVGTGENVRVAAFSAYIAPFRASTSTGRLVGEAGFLADGPIMYEILGYTRQGGYRQYRKTFRSVILSFDRLRDPKALGVQPYRITLYRVGRSTTLRRALARAGVRQEMMEELALVNNMELGDRVPTGTLLKTLKRGRPL